MRQSEREREREGGREKDRERERERERENDPDIFCSVEAYLIALFIVVSGRVRLGNEGGGG